MRLSFTLPLRGRVGMRSMTGWGDEPAHVASTDA
jgi:hypothetical protein